MADKFNPRGAPVPSTGYYDGWELTHRPSMFPFLAEYTNAQGETSGGMAMPSMVEEPINALSRLLNTPSGTMPAPNDPQNQKDALLGLMSLYGGNALGGMARGVAGRAAGHALEMETASPVAYSNAIEGAMRNPNMLRMMDDIDYAGLNRRALNEYGVGYEGLNSSQEAALRGWSDPSTFLSDTSRPSLLGAALMSGAQGNPVLAQSGEQSPGDYLKDQHQNREPYEQDYQSVPPADMERFMLDWIKNYRAAHPEAGPEKAYREFLKSPEYNEKRKGTKRIPFDQIPDFIPPK